MPGKDHSSHYLHGPGQLEDLGRGQVEAGIRLSLPFHGQGALRSWRRGTQQILYGDCHWECRLWPMLRCQLGTHRNNWIVMGFCLRLDGLKGPCMGLQQ